MYKIIGADGNEYGPVSADQIRQWIAEHRLIAQSKVQAEGTTEWRALCEFPEFADALRTAAPPKHTAAETTPPKTSGMAIASLVLGLLSFVSCGLTALITSPLGLILGLVAINKINKSSGRLRGQGYALAGTIISGVTIFLIPFFAGLLVPAFIAAKEKTQTVSCMNHVKQLALAVRIYALDNNDRFPFATNWCDAVSNNVSELELFQCPAGRKDSNCHYAFNARLSGVETKKADQDIVMIFESDAGWNANGGPELLLQKPRHQNRVVIAFADGSVRQVPAAKLDQLRWEPKHDSQ